MLKGEQAEAADTQDSQPGPLTYGSYLRVPELLQLQTRLGVPEAHDEMLFIIVQQAQELWFKQMLHEIRAIIGLMANDELLEATRLLNRVSRIIKMLGEEASILESMPPQEFHRFRHVLVSSSGFESEQFRELELASGLKDPMFLKLIEKHTPVEQLRARWPVTLHDSWLNLVSRINPDPARAVVEIYRNHLDHKKMFLLAEALSEYEVLFAEWRFRHIKLVERTIGDNSPGTAGSSGVGYLGKTLGYRFFPELWEARNKLTAGE